MAYTPNTWQDRLGVGLNQFKDQDGKEYTFTPNPTAITQAGTPFSADWMNHIEQGIAAISNLFGANNDYFTLRRADDNSEIAVIGSYSGTKDGFIHIYDAAGTLQATLEANSTGGGRLQLYTSSEKVCTELGQSANDSGGYIDIKDDAANTKATIFYEKNSDAGAMQFYGPDGTYYLSFTLGNNKQNGFIYVKSPPTTTSAANMAFVSNGNGYLVNLVSSSRKYKTNIKTVSSEDAIDIIKKINPVSYEEIETGNKHYGYIAEEMSEVCPLLTEYDDKGQPRSIQYDRVSVLLVRALQDVYSRLEKAEEKLQALGVTK